MPLFLTVNPKEGFVFKNIVTIFYRQKCSLQNKSVWSYNIVLMKKKRVAHIKVLHVISEKRQNEHVEGWGAYF